MSAKQALISSLRSSDILEMKALESFSLTPSLGYVANRSLHRQTTLVYEAKLSLLNPIFKSDHRPQGFRKPSWIWRSKFSITVESSKCSQNFCRRAVKCSACNNGTEQECGVLQQIQTLCGGEISEEESEGRPQFIEGKLLSEVSTWGIGGPAKYFMEVHSEAEMVSLTRYCKRHNVRIIVIGKGSNCLFDDLGFDGCVILNCIDYVENPERGMYRVGSGHAFNQLGVRCSKEGYTGLEFACGIPGTVGGAVYMNAGANGQDTAHVLKSVEILTVKGERIVLLKEKGDLKYSYRRSPFQMMQNFGAVTAATFELVYNPESKQRHIDLLRRYLPGGRRTSH
ncbi:hypothetical protein O6H91_09G050000 [Diphasiastrum complanatum]|uniref:Uncharacterized protein n=1 Tax=Diphasiastrum complanatum TaxID=34168 RepID=A0ACC2CNV8_DIPCM|nr:hypothetical protein O6H91_09G050000 [Diphasiastrum complanatum]